MSRHDVGIELAQRPLRDAPKEARLDVYHGLGPAVGIRAQMIE